MNQRAKYLGQGLFLSKVIISSQKHTHRHTNSGPTALPAPLKWLVINLICMRVVRVNTSCRRHFWQECINLWNKLKPFLFSSYWQCLHVIPGQLLHLFWWSNVVDYFAPPRRGAKYCDDRVRMPVCLSVCMSERSHISKTACPNFTKFSVGAYILPVAVARSCCDYNAIRYVLPVLCMTSRFTITGHMARG